MNKINYQLQLDQTLEKLGRDGRIPRLLLHSCCAPCSSYCLEYLSQFFYITLFYYNPNIAPANEHEKRAQELQRFVSELPVVYPVTVIIGAYEPKRFYSLAEGLEKQPEGGERCFRCYALRLEEAGRIAKEGKFDYFTTTLSISPHKDASKLNEIGQKIEHSTGVAYLYSDFKKRGGYKRSTELSEQYHLYRQDYCGCIYSKGKG